ncbi:hypothetical protein CRM22_001089, partial [Opisthorchis felineus]
MVIPLPFRHPMAMNAFFHRLCVAKFRLQEVLLPSESAYACKFIIVHRLEVAYYGDMYGGKFWASEFIKIAQIYTQ